jgi:hypothetical protein
MWFVRCMCTQLHGGGATIEYSKQLLDLLGPLGPHTAELQLVPYRPSPSPPPPKSSEQQAAQGSAGGLEVTTAPAVATAAAAGVEAADGAAAGSPAVVAVPEAAPVAAPAVLPMAAVFGVVGCSRLGEGVGRLIL